MSSGFSVIAIIAAYNEADIVEQVIGALIEQGVRVYFLDDGSTDGTVSAVERYVGRGVVGIERLADTRDAAAPARFEWERILLRKTQLARELDADWFIHHDADEFRESVWSGVTLRDAIQRVDALGFNAIDFAGLDFWPSHDRFRAGDDVRQTFTSYAEPGPYDRVQIRCWKKTSLLDLASSGGHEARFPGRNVFPLRFILRHYPIRGQAHGDRKVFEERRSRFSPQELARGWHLHYDHMHEGMSFIRDPATLTPYDPAAVRLGLTLRPRAVEELEESLVEVRSAAEAHRLESERRRGELLATQAELGASRAETAMLRDVVDSRTAELSARQAELATRLAELVALRADLDGRLAEIGGLRAGLEHRADEVGRWRSAMEDATRRLDAFERSFSWRWTAPARAAYRILRGR